MSKVDASGWMALIVGTGIIAWSGVLVRFLDVGPLAGAAWRTGLATPVLAVWAQSVRRPSNRPRDIGRYLRPLLLSGVAFAVDVGSFHISLTGAKVANASFIGNVAPILAVAGGALFFGDTPPLRVWPALAVALLGSWVMAGLLPPSRIGYGDGFALLAAVAYASYLLCIKQARAGLDGPTATMISAAVSAVLLAIAAVARGETLIPSSAAGWITVFVLGFVSHAGGQGLTSVAVGRVPVGLVALVILVQPAASAALAYFILGEPMTPVQMGGGAMILSAVYFARPK